MGTEGGRADEAPSHDVELSPFFLGRTPVTRGRIRAVPRRDGDGRAALVVRRGFRQPGSARGRGDLVRGRGLHGMALARVRGPRGVCRRRRSGRERRAAVSTGAATAWGAIVPAGEVPTGTPGRALAGGTRLRRTRTACTTSPPSCTSGVSTGTRRASTPSRRRGIRAGPTRVSASPAAADRGGITCAGLPRGAEQPASVVPIRRLRVPRAAGERMSATGAASGAGAPSRRARPHGPDGRTGVRGRSAAGRRQPLRDDDRVPGADEGGRRPPVPPRGGRTQDRRLRARRLLHGAGGGAPRLRGRPGVRRSPRPRCASRSAMSSRATPARIRRPDQGRRRSLTSPIRSAPAARDTSMASTARP